MATKKEASKNRTINLGSKREVNELVAAVAQRGSLFGDSIIGTMVLTATSLEGIAISVIGLARAYAALKCLSGKGHVDITGLFEDEVALFEEEIESELQDDLKRKSASDC